MDFQSMVECRQRLRRCHVGRYIIPDSWADNWESNHRM